MKGREEERERDGALPSVDSFFDGHNTKVWARQKPEAQNSIQISCMGNRVQVEPSPTASPVVD